jgi:hypothetical protein
MALVASSVSTPERTRLSWKPGIASATVSCAL